MNCDAEMSGALRLTASSLSSGRFLQPGRLLELELEGSLESPAVSLSATLQCDEAIDGFGEIRLSDERRTVFSGRCDESRTVLGGEGLLLHLEARSRGALLLDNEAQPVTLWGANLSTIFRRHIAPYGFGLSGGTGGGTLAVFPVQRGMSEWEAFAGFCRRITGVSPWVRGEMVLAEKPVYGNVRLVISNEGEGIPFTELERVLRPYRMLSKVVLRDENKLYSSSVSNSATAYYGVSRRRYVTPSTEFEDNPGLDANQRIRRSMWEAEEWEASIPQLVAVAAGDGVEVRQKGFSKAGLLVNRWQWRMGAQGGVTRLWLKRADYL